MKEIKALIKIGQIEVVEKGMIQFGDEMYGYYIMPRLGVDLDRYFTDVESNFSNKTVHHLGICLLKSLETIHNAGYVYNDLKLDNILVDLRAKLPKAFTSKNAFEKAEIHMIDFGYASKYLDK